MCLSTHPLSSIEHLSSFHFFFLNLLTHSKECYRSSEEQGTASTEYHTKYHGECEATNAISTQCEDTNQYNQCTY